MTSAEAETKWCPLARVQQQATVSYQSYDPHSGAGQTRNVETAVVVNRDAGGMPHWNARCISTRCAMWRKHALDSDDGNCGLAGFAIHGG